MEIRIVTRKLFAVLALALALPFCLTAADGPVAPALHKVDGLELPADFEVDQDEGFVEVVAKCAGPVEWVVLSTSTRLKYKVNEAAKSVTIAVPRADNDIVVYCYGLVENKLTRAAKTTIQVRGPPSPEPQPDPDTGKVPTGTKFHIVMVESADPTKRTPETAKVITSAALRQQLINRGHVVRTYLANDPILASKGIDKVVARVGVPALIVIQPPAAGQTKGKLVLERQLPQSETDFLKVIDGLSK